MIKKYILTFFLVLVQAVVFGATITSTATGGLWSSGSSWVGGVVPSSADDVIIPSGLPAPTIIVNADAFAKSINVSGILTINHGKTLTVYGNVDVVSGAQFNAGTGNSDTAIIKVYGNFTNSGTANFWKSTVVIAGDLVTGSTILQNNGEIIVGGNVSAIISGGGNGYVYPVNPNATVSVTGTSNAQVAGTIPTDSALLSLMYEVIYGGNCPFVGNTANVSACSGTNVTFSVTFSSNPATGTPTYQWEVNMNNGSGWVSTGVTTASLTITGVTISMDGYKYRAKITWNGCTKSVNYGVLTVNSVPTITTQPITQLDCEERKVDFEVIATGTGLTYVWQYKKPMDSSYTTIIGSTSNVDDFDKSKIGINNVGSTQFPNGTLFQVIVTNSNGCSVTSSAATLLVNEITGVDPIATSVIQCYGTNYSYTVSTSTPPPGYVVSYQWKSSVTTGVWNNVVDGTHFSGATTATLNILNGTPAESAEYRVYVTFHFSGTDCNVDSSTRSRTITFLPQITAPVAVITQPTCSVATGSVVLSGLPSGNWTINPGGITGNTASTTISGLAAGTYNFTVSDGTCTSLASADVVINTQPQTPAVPTLSTVTQPICAGATGSFTITNYNASYTYAASPSTGVSISGNVVTAPEGNYTLTATLGSCTSVASVATDVIDPTLSVNLTNIIGAPNACLRDLGTFSITETAGFTITSRQWGIRTVSGGPIIPLTGAIGSSLNPNDFINRSDTSTQELEIPDEFILVCTSTSDCGVSALSNEFTVKAPPPTPGAISGNFNQCAGNTGQVFSVPAMPEATGGFHWYLPSGWEITAGANASTGIGTNEITVTIGETVFAGQITVNSINDCGESYGASYSPWTVVSLESNGGEVSANNAVTCGAYPSTILTTTGYVGNIIGWEYSPDGFVDQTKIKAINVANHQLYLSSLDPTLGLVPFTRDAYFRTVAVNGGCGFAFSAPVLVKMSQPMTNPTELYIDGTPYSAGVTHCANTSNVLSINPVDNAETYEWIVPAGWTITSGQGTISINVTTGGTSTSGTVEVLAKNGGCNDAHSYFYFYLVPSNAPTVDLTQPTCAVPTGTITVTSPAPAAGISYTIKGTSSATTEVTNETGVFSGLAPGNYDVTVNNASYVDIFGTYPKAVTPLSNCATTTSVTIDPLATNSWTGTWSNGTPTADQNLVFNAGFSSTSNVEGCSCTVTSGAVVFNPTHTLKIGNWVHVNGGSLTFENSASLVQINNVANIGNITYKRNYTGGEFDYTYWSSPVAGQNLLALSPTTKLDKFFSFNSILNDWVQENPATATMAIGKGFIIRGIPPPPGPPPGFGTNSFIGIPNNGDIPVPVVFTNSLLPLTDPDYGVSYLLGNPYPSAIYADQFLFDNQSVIDGTLYFWTHNTPIAIGTPNPGTGVWAYSGNDYASYNITGGVGTGSGTSAVSGGVVPSGKIAAGQGFFATCIATGTVNFTNAMRLDSSGNPLNNSNFYKTRNPKSKTTNPIEKHRVWLNLTNTQGAFKQTLVGYISGATNTWDGLYDGKSFDGNDFLDFYSINQDKNLTIQGRALPFDENDEIPLGYRIAVEGNFTISIDVTDGKLTNQPIFIEDKLTNTVTDLKSGNYTFSTAAGTFNERFVLRYKDNSSNRTLSVDETETDASEGIVVLYSNNYKTLIIRNNGDSTINSVTLFNLLGQKITDWEVKDSEQTTIQIPIKNISSEIYIVKVKSTKGEISKKIVVKE